MKVQIGRYPLDGDRRALLDIERLVESRAFIQASSGFGKSYLLAELIEATHGYIQQIVIDPEGEFAVLRKDLDFVIAAAHGGDAIAHPRTASLLATRLLETKASAILDIYDVKPRERHEFVRNFLTAMMEARKELWHPVLVFLDEAHLFCPEKGMGESEAMDAVIDLAGRGRKRGFTLVAATQRIGKFNKSALAELHNKFIGFASLDVDVKRAAFELGKTPKDALEDFRALKPGDFYAFGPALQFPSPTLFKGTLPQTKLPKAGHRKLVSPPKPTDKIRALLPQLSDLPREVEQKAKTEAELRKDLADARRELEHLKRVQPIAKASLAKLKADPEHEKEAKRMHDAGFDNGKIVGANAVYQKLKSMLEVTEKSVVRTMSDSFAKTVKDWTEGIRTVAGCERARQETAQPMKEFKHITKIVVQPMAQKQEPLHEIRTVSPIGDTHLSGAEQRILDAIAWMSTMTSKEEVTQTAAAFIAKYTPGSSSFRNPRSALAAKGLIDYASNGDIWLTEAGKEQARFPERVATSAELQDRVLDILAGPEKKLMNELLDKYPAGMTQEEHAIASGYTPGSSSYRNPRSKLASLGLLRYEGDRVYAEKWLFLE